MIKHRLGFLERWIIPSYLSPDEITTGLVEFDADACRRCGVCAGCCPTAAITVPKAKVGAPSLLSLSEDMYVCFACGNCVSSCAHDAVVLKRRYTAHSYFNRMSRAPEMTYPKRY